MQRTALVLVAALVAACDAPPPSAPRSISLTPAASRAGEGNEATAREAAWGAGTVRFGATVEQLRFRARRADDRRNPFAARGDAYFNNRTARVRGHIEVNCLRVTGNTATISGIVTESNDPTIEGFEALFTVVDNDLKTKGKKPADQASTVLLHEVGIGPDCAVFSEFDLVPIKGQVEVQPEVGS
jgi:hypothetical protein